MKIKSELKVKSLNGTCARCFGFLRSIPKQASCATDSPLWCERAPGAPRAAEFGGMDDRCVDLDFRDTSGS